MQLKFLFVAVLMAVASFDVSAVTIGSAGAWDAGSNTVYANGLVGSGGINADDSAKLQMISTLENDITILDAEIRKCEKSKKGWIAATVIGSAGVVATGVAAGVQGAKLSKKKDELKDINTDIANKQKELNSINGGGN